MYKYIPLGSNVIYTWLESTFGIWLERTKYSYNNALYASKEFIMILAPQILSFFHFMVANSRL